MKPLTKTPWFGPKRLIGWGLSPRTWQGGIVMIVFIAAVMLSIYLAKNLLVKFIVLGILVVLFIIVVLLTGGKPGRPSK